MDSLTLARALHTLGLVHWIGGVAFVTLVVLPAVRHFVEPERRLALFEAIERRFAFQARFSVTLVGLSGFYMTDLLDAWDRFLQIGYWWMHAMVLIWLVFALILFLAEPLFLDAWLRRRAKPAPAATFAFVQRAHLVLLAASAIALGAAVLGTHGLLY